MTSMEFDLESAPGAVSHNAALITVFNALQMAGIVLLIVVVLTARLAPTVKRSPAWYNIIIAWIVSSSSSLLLMGWQTGHKPPFGLCLLQSMPIHAAPAMNACACLCFALELFFGVFGVATQTRTPTVCKVFIVSLPYVTTFLVCLEVLTIGLIDKQLVERNALGMYRHLITSAPLIVTDVIVLLVMAWVFPVVEPLSCSFSYATSATLGLLVPENGGVPRRMIIRFGAICVLLPLPVVAVILSSRQVCSASLSIIIATPRESSVSGQAVGCSFAEGSDGVGYQARSAY
ncbi:hypothetical protein BDN71DRAFT_1445965 [Pleurotus eryngii]|uniref:Uncharacterized protein n=1 Tax=Pleurotus eryngii TaxID=5323 RepID=A0A9P6DH02_PLEER|nr:hypothetical protein BDN71DRAFT_1445965 [Pleurotus eryngii]